MQKIKAIFSSSAFWTILVVAILALMSLSLWSDLIKANREALPENIEVQTENTFRGPVGEPHIIGPSGPPPS